MCSGPFLAVFFMTPKRIYMSKYKGLANKNKSIVTRIFSPAKYPKTFGTLRYIEGLEKNNIF